MAAANLSQQGKHKAPFNEDEFKKQVAKINLLSKDTKNALDVLLDQLIESDGSRQTLKSGVERQLDCVKEIQLRSVRSASLLVRKKNTQSVEPLLHSPPI